MSLPMQAVLVSNNGKGQSELADLVEVHRSFGRRVRIGFVLLQCCVLVLQCRILAVHEGRQRRHRLRAVMPQRTADFCLEQSAHSIYYYWWLLLVREWRDEICYGGFFIAIGFAICGMLQKRHW